MSCQSCNADGPSQRVETSDNTAVSISRQPLDGDCCISNGSRYALDRGDLAALTLLDLSAAASDIVDRRTLIRRLEAIQHSLHSSRLVLDISRTTYTQHVRCKVAVPTLQSYCVGTSLKDLSWDRSCLSSTSPTLLILSRKAACVHIFTLMTHRYMVSALRMTLRPLQNRVTVCINDVDKWMASNRLELNAAKTEVL